MSLLLLTLVYFYLAFMHHILRYLTRDTPLTKEKSVKKKLTQHLSGSEVIALVADALKLVGGGGELN